MHLFAQAALNSAEAAALRDCERELRQRWERDLAGRSVNAFGQNSQIEELSVKKELENCGLGRSRVQICSRICRNWLKIIFQNLRIEDLEIPNCISINSFEDYLFNFKF